MNILKDNPLGTQAEFRISVKAALKDLKASECLSFANKYRIKSISDNGAYFETTTKSQVQFFSVYNLGRDGIASPLTPAEKKGPAKVQKKIPTTEPDNSSKTEPDNQS